jgi:hypothetical protein
MITIAHRVGRLIECRLASPMTDDELATFARERQRIVEALNHDRAVCMDMTALRTLTPDHAAWLMALVRPRMPGLARSASLLSDDGDVTPEVERILGDANHSTLRTFRDRAPLEAWLGEVLTAGERRRLTRFLDATD